MQLDLERLRECRKKAGLNKKETAKLAHVSQPAYVRYELGERSPSVQVIKEIASVLHTSLEYLTGESDSAEITSYTINQEEAPVLFEIVEKTSTFNAKQMERVLAYASKIYDKNANK